jgi:hypothetical protein
MASGDFEHLLPEVWERSAGEQHERLAAVAELWRA